MTYELNLVENRLPRDGTLLLAPAHRVIYLVDGALAVAADGAQAATTMAANQARYAKDACRLEAAAEGAVAWRWELVPPGMSRPDRHGVKLAHPIELDPASRYLIRCDRVDFPLGGVAYTHTHRGPGIRVLLQGRFRVEVGGQAHTIEPGQAWFERGPDPVYATASDTALTSFVRVMILPVELQGRSSIQYVKPEDQDRPKSQRYTVFVDTPIAL